MHIPFAAATAAAAAAATAALASELPLKIDIYNGRVAIQWGEALEFDSSSSALQSGDVVIRRCDDGARGRGAFVCRPGGLQRGKFLGTYTGEILGFRDYESRYAALHREPEYVMRIDSDCFVDASAIAAETGAEPEFHPAFINHATGSACNVVRRCASRRPPVVELFTNEAISEGTELLMDYGRDFWRGREAVELPVP